MPPVDSCVYDKGNIKKMQSNQYGQKVSIEKLITVIILFLLLSWTHL